MLVQSLCRDERTATNGCPPVVDRDETPMRMAIVGMACRLPGQVSSPDDFWRLCSRGRSAWSEVPRSRFNHAAFHHLDPQRAGTLNPKGGHFLDEDLGRFDAPFFNITLQEARALDPQQRLLLECTYEALENAGIPKQSLAGRNVGVFAGASFADYEMRNMRDPETIPMHQATGNAVSLQANRISYYFDLNGPSLTVDTACSSSLTAVHLACQSLRAGECSVAIVGGAHLNVTPELFISMSSAGVFSDSGRSYAFDHRASGFGRGEGGGCLILKPLDAALAAGDAVRAVIAGSGVNQDGRTRGITLPNSAAQETLIRSVYKAAHIDPSETGYVEAHGTGTRAGDPLEASALHAVFGKGRTPKEPLFVGSVKTNIGHTEGASGVISVIKTAMMLERGFVLPNCGFQRANDEIPLDQWNIKIPKKLVPWPRGKKYASINNFGFGGANAHVVLEQFPSLHDGGANDKSPALKRKIITLSGQDETAVNEQVKKLGFYLEQNPAVFQESVFNNLAYTLAQRRTGFSWRLALAGCSTLEIGQQLSAEPKPSRAQGSTTIGFVFTGQGAQWFAMGKELLPSYPAFRRTMEAIDNYLSSLGARFSIIHEIESGDATSSSISKAYMSQPACTAIQLALTDLLHSWGIFPSAVTGHSSGEIAAAYAAGILTLDECVRVAYARGAAAALLTKDTNKGKGSMLAVGASCAAVQPYLDGLRGHRAVVACINSESSVTVSGDDGAICELQSTLDKDGIFARKLQVDVAYHSHHMQRVSKQYRELIGGIAPQSSSVPFHSTVRGRRVLPSDLDATYWVENLVSRVEFVLGVRSLLEQKVSAGEPEKPINTVVEIGPHCALQTPIKQIIEHHFANATIQYFPSLKRKVNAVEAMQRLAIALWTQGLPLDFEAINFPDVQTGHQRRPAVLINLSPYPWNHSASYWHPSRLSDNAYQRPFPRNDILGSLSMENIDLEPRWRNVISADDQPWIRQHRIHENSVYPMAGFLAMAVEAVVQQVALHQLALDRIEMRELTVGRALIIPDSSSVETMLSMRPCIATSGNSPNLWHEFRIFSWSQSRGWDEHCHGFIVCLESKEPNPVDGRRQQSSTVSDATHQAAAMREACTTAVDSESLYEHIAQRGAIYGPLFRGLSDVAVSNGHEVMAKVEVPDTRLCMPKQHETPCILHPALLDQCLQLLWVLFKCYKPGPKVTHLPSFVKRISISPFHGLQPGNKLQVYGTQIQAISTRHPLSNRMIATHPADPAKPVIEIDGCVTVPLPYDDGKVSEAKPLCYREHFQPCFDFLSEADSDLLAGPDPGNGPGAQRTRLLDEVSYLYLQRAVRSVSKNEIPSFKPHLQRAFRWAQKVCSVSTLDTSLCAQHGGQERLIQKVRSMNAVGELTCKLGERLSEMLRGNLDPLAVMMEEDLLSRHYEDNDHYLQNYVRATKCIDAMAHQNPHLKFLEVGAGTGGATLPILQTLGGEGGTTPRFSHFTYTDISPAFFEKAKDKFQAWGSLMSYQTLDISSDPIPQGFEPHSYDVVIACNVLHATPLIRQTVGNVRRLLKPGGKLLLIEETRLKPSHFIYALLPGWWLSEDPDRKNGPLLDPGLWQRVLKHNAFSGVDLGIDDYPGAPQRACTLMVSTASDTQLRPSSSDVIVMNTGFLIPSLCRTLQQKLKDVTAGVVNTRDFTTDPTGKLCIFVDDPNTPLLSSLTQEHFQALQKMLARASGVLWVIQKGNTGPESLGAHLAVGLARTVRSETSLPFATLDVGVKGSLSENQLADKIRDVFNEVLCNSSVLRHGDMDYVVQQGRVCVSRLVDYSELNESLFQDTEHAAPQHQVLWQPSRPLKMVPGGDGVLSGCFFTDNGVINSPLPDDHVEIQVHYVGLNFRDILVAMSQIHGGQLGQECSGIITAVGAAVEDFRVGDRVCSMSPGCLASHVRSPASNMWRVPNTMNLELAASAPLVFATAYYSLVDIGRLAPGETVLIHAAAGGVGQAAIMVAEEIGAKVFATVSSEEKKAFLMDTYQLPEEQIFFSRDMSFATGIHKATGGQGVDVALNSLTGDALRATFECLAPFGRFVELGKRDIIQNARLEMAHFDKNVSFSSIDLALIIRTRPALTKRLFGESFRLFTKPRTQARWSIASFSIAELESAFRALQGGRATGKIVVQIKKGAMVKVHPARKPGDILFRNASYIVTGGTRGIGLDIARWLPEKGARHLILVSRSGAASEESRQALETLKAEGVTVEVCRCDVGDPDDFARALVPVLKRMPPVRGVVYGAMVLRDMLFEKMSLDDYNAVIRPRMHGILNLQRILQRQKGSELDFFINLSSLSSVVGTMGQAAYASSGTFMAAMAQYPALAGVPCRTIDLPMVRDIGYLATDQKRLEKANHQLGGISVDPSDIRAVLAAAFRNEMKDSASNHCLLGLNGIRSTPVKELPFWARDPKLSHLLRSSILSEVQCTQTQQHDTKVSPASAVRHAPSYSAAESLVVDAVVHKIASTLMRPVDEIDPSAHISGYGLDSLVAIEIRNWITRELESNLQILEILTSDSLYALTRTILSKTGLISSTLRAAWDSEAFKAV